MLKWKYSNKKEGFAMKRRKVLWLALIGLLLSGCKIDITVTSRTSEAGGGGGDSQAGTAVSKGEANNRVTAAFIKSDIAGATTYQQVTNQDVRDTYKDYVNEELVYDADEHITVVSEIKVTGLKTDDPKLMVTGELVDVFKEEGVENYYYETDRELYFTEGWFYVHENYKERVGGPSEPLDTGEIKLKQNFGPITGPEMAEMLKEMDLIELPIPAMHSEGATNFLGQVQNVTAVKSGNNLTVTYNLTKADVMTMLETSFRAAINPEDYTSEELADLEEFIAWYLALMEEILEVTLYKITIGINGDDYLTQVRSDIDVTMTTVIEPNEWHPEGRTQVQKSAGFIDLKPKFNETFTITFPDFSDYIEGEIFGE